jgi:hypothetical protein
VKPKEAFHDRESSGTEPRAIWATQVTAVRALETVVRGFEGARIDVLAVKGIITARLLYRDPIERPMGDVDVRIRAEDAARALEVAKWEGWRVAENKPSYGAFVLFVEELGVSVDVESVLGAPGLCALSIAEMLERAPRGIAGLDVRFPEIHDHAILLAINVFKDKLALASPWAIEDARRIVELSEFDASVFVERVLHAKVAAIVWMVADWIVRERKSEVWAQIRLRLGGERGPRPLYARALGRLMQKAPTGMATRVLARMGSDDPRMWLGAVARAASLELRGEKPRRK